MMYGRELKKNRFLAVCLCLMVVVSGCGSLETQTSTSLPVAASPTLAPTSTSTPAAQAPTAALTPEATMPPDWQYRWLKGVPCKPPCWEGITPGKTTAEEGIKILQQKPFILSGSVRKAPEIPKGQTGSEFGEVYWNWMYGTTQNNIFRFDTNSPDPIITNISPYSSIPVATLGDIIKVYGNPEYVEAHNSVAPAIQFLWLNKGLAVATHGKGGDKELSLTPALSFEMPTFFIPRTLEQYVGKGPLAVIQFIPWQGYQDFMFYCNLSTQGRC